MTSLLVFAFPGVGKTTISSKDNRFIDMEVSEYKYHNESVQHIDKEARKAIPRPKVKGYLKTYRQVALQHYACQKIVMLAMTHVLLFIQEYFTHQWLFVFPDIRLRRAYKSRYIHRGNNLFFIWQVMMIWYVVISVLQVLSYLFPDKFIRLTSPDEYIIDAFNEKEL